jgi:hypothetical protein
MHLRIRAKARRRPPVFTCAYRIPVRIGPAEFSPYSPGTPICRVVLPHSCMAAQPAALTPVAVRPPGLIPPCRRAPRPVGPPRRRSPEPAYSLSWARGAASPGAGPPPTHCRRPRRALAGLAGPDRVRPLGGRHVGAQPGEIAPEGRARSAQGPMLRLRVSRELAAVSHLGTHMLAPILDGEYIAIQLGDPLPAFHGQF